RGARWRHWWSSVRNAGPGILSGSPLSRTAFSHGQTHFRQACVNDCPRMPSKFPKQPPNRGPCGLTGLAGLHTLRTMRSRGTRQGSRGASAIGFAIAGIIAVTGMAGGTDRNTQAAAKAQDAAKAGAISVEKVTCVNLPNCYKLSNGQAEVVVTTDIGPRVMRYALVGGENILGEVPGSAAEKDKNTWQSWGGHRLWIAPEGQPKSYGPDNRPIKHTVTGSTIRLEQPVEPGTGIQKTMTVTLDASGSGVTLKHTLTNRGQKPFELAPWALTVMNPGGAAIIPQEPY